MSINIIGAGNKYEVPPFNELSQKLCSMLGTTKLPQHSPSNRENQPNQLLGENCANILMQISMLVFDAQATGIKSLISSQQLVIENMNNIGDAIQTAATAFVDYVNNLQKKIADAMYDAVHHSGILDTILGSLETAGGTLLAATAETGIGLAISVALIADGSCRLAGGVAALTDTLNMETSGWCKDLMSNGMFGSLSLAGMSQGAVDIIQTIYNVVTMAAGFGVWNSLSTIARVYLTINTATMVTGLVGSKVADSRGDATLATHFNAMSQGVAGVTLFETINGIAEATDSKDDTWVMIVETVANMLSMLINTVVSAKILKGNDQINAQVGKVMNGYNLQLMYINMWYT